MKTGNLSIHTENIFPIIKKFLYSNQEVFLRELVANAVDATQKLKTLSSRGETGEIGDTRIRISIDADAKTLTISDRGIGMDADEVEKYINQIAFSSAEEFLNKYKDEGGAQIIGHFGLGFYSAFMVADKVEIFTRSYKPNAEAQHWSCDGSTTFSLEATEKAERGTDIVLHINEDSAEFLRGYRISDILTKYCKFLPVEIEFEEKVINNPNPLWRKRPADLTDDDYKDFYQELYPFTEPPLFWIHLNVDFPFNLTGVLYFPKVRPNMELTKNRIHLYSNQVFITENVDDVVPDYMNLLQGVLDSPDIPLNVSRSYLQTDGNVRKISAHISKKVADKLNGLFFDDRKDFEQKWESVGVFVKYGMIRDNAFFDRAKDFCLLYNTEGEYYTMDEYKEKVAPLQTNKDGKTIVLYATNAEEQNTFIRSAQKRGYDVLLLDGVIDMHFIGYVEHRWDNVELVRVDANSVDKLIDKGIEKASLLNEDEQNELKTIYQSQINNPFASVLCQPLSEDDLPVTVTKPEHQRRLQDMAQMGMLGASKLPDSYQVILNSSHPLAKRILLSPEGAERDQLVRHSYELGLLTQNMLVGDQLTQFIERNVALLSKN